ncbi:ice-binding family protein [Fibrella arboris]|uniref:ice-binding family protein n=1 Tax=Fibrella arboris TaxID=3242486 RepID=UPI0035204D61
MKKELLPLIVYVLLLVLPITGFGQAPSLGTASTFALFTANGAFNSTGAAAVVTGDVGTRVGAFNAFPPGTVTGQVRLPGSTQATQAALDVATAYNALTSVTCSTLISPILGNGQTLTAGVYCQTTAAASSLVGTLTLNGPGTYIIKLNSALTTAAGSTINLTNGACLNDVYFQVNGAVDLGAGSAFRGTILANGAISLQTGATLEGRGLSIAGAISIRDNTVTTYAQTMAVAVTAGACSTATNTYDLAGVISLTSAVAGTLTITDGDGSSSTTASVTTGQTSVAFGLSGLTSGTGTHTVLVTGPGCSSAAITYNAPSSCTSAASVPATLTGTVYADNNATTVRDSGDTPIAGVVVTLLNSSSLAVASTTSGPSGTYSFTGLTAGQPYSVRFSTPVGYTIAAPASGITGPLTLTSGATVGSVDAGYRAIAPTLTLGLFVDRSIARVGNTLTYSIVLTNSGNGPAGNVVVRDSTSAGLSYLANSATVPAGTTFTQGTPNSWFIASLSAGQSLSLTFQAVVDGSGILYNTVSIPGDTLRVCTSIPVKLCPGDEYILSVPAGSASYRWFKDGVPIQGQTTNELAVSAPGSYSLGIDNAGGQCPNFSCCPFIVEADTLPVFVAAAIPATCISNSAQSNGQIGLSGFNATHTYQYSLGMTFDPANSLSGTAQPIPANGLIASTLANPVVAQAYTVRVTNSSGCYTDVTVMLLPTSCTCPTDVCVPFVIRKIRGVAVTR